MWFSKKEIKERLLATENKRQKKTSANSIEELTEQYLEDVNGGRGWWRAYARWSRSF